ncbi:50S ribosomal protein L17 [Tautonia plasticadhaerens]|uniref:Large ribosomal subunit protein bL17 n=1 Tax=Tautonia plasticadhaerens TaxID=2527974 RepID=A0A518GUE6_9BACT|nr:50S ribosomal protein L17 [Tautonia plasticadhaerens]QDV32215.1 50S ribosomal protein L17 [Tautonia plasticadhaerens]
MRHRKAGRKFKRSPEHRRMLMRNLATSFFEHERIETTQAKAKELQPYAEKLITMAVRGIRRQKALGGDAADKLPLAEFRRILTVLTRKDVAYKLFFEIAPRYMERPGGYSRIFKLAHRRQGDCSQMAIIQLIGADEPVRSQSVQPEVVGSEA